MDPHVLCLQIRMTYMQKLVTVEGEATYKARARHDLQTQNQQTMNRKPSYE